MASVPEKLVSSLRYKDQYQICDLQEEFRRGPKGRRENTIMTESNAKQSNGGELPGERLFRYNR